MIITRGLGTGLLITMGYGTLVPQAIDVFPYCPAPIPYVEATPMMASIPMYGAMVSPFVDTPPPYSDNLVYNDSPTPYSDSGGVVGEVNPVTGEQEPYTEDNPFGNLPNHCS